MIRGVHHCSISTPDRDRLVRFYTDLIGAELVFSFGWEKGSAEPDTIVGLRDTSAVVAHLRLGNCMIEIQEYRSPVGRSREGDRPVNDHGLSHLCLDVVDLDAEFDRLRVAGVKFQSSPVQVDYVKAVYTRDPDGNILELQEILDPDASINVF